MQLRSQFAVTLVVAAVMAGGWLWWSDGNKAAQSREPAKKRGGATLVLVEPAIAAEDKLIVRAIGTGEALKSASNRSMRLICASVYSTGDSDLSLIRALASVIDK